MTPFPASARLCSLLLPALLMMPAPVFAGGGWHGGNFFGFSVTLPLAFGFPPPVYVPPPPAFYPPVAYPPSAYVPVPQPVPAAPLATRTSPTYLGPGGRYCRDFQMPGVVGGRPATLVGTACLDPDGQWRVIG
ncbi:hypothetical protein D9623_16600 [Azospirillum brasilense]|uniref:Surface antigen n=1 Tax=Azospirillum brasilense TaxID=192 RepID=A0A0P0F133_AZOBR|nr:MULTISPECIES: hypothetical protein [Azospirillum]ALJ36839.1 hypothetical protein AMK58_15050 [Azospirillum brasilense]MDW7555858.1 hypothetical protein [Azospirillum brasilense]MDW7595935.1 hypothetical protein [Azospirillum brasilense]MDW7630940.1 hypothetical protein [Azospirillum brasilense]MDX5951546.1 hypothetical protein [Azospirillum brasilense]